MSEDSACANYSSDKPAETSRNLQKPGFVGITKVSTWLPLSSELSRTGSIRFTYRGVVIRVFGDGYRRKGKRIYEKKLIYTFDLVLERWAFHKLHDECRTRPGTRAIDKLARIRSGQCAAYRPLRRGRAAPDDRLPSRR